MRRILEKSKLVMLALGLVLAGLLAVAAVTYWEFNEVIEAELINTMEVRTQESASHINTLLAGQLGEVQETVNSPVLAQVLYLNPQLDFSRRDESVELIDELNQARWKYVSAAYPQQYAALHIINALETDDWGRTEKLGQLQARYYNVREGNLRTDAWAKAAAEEAGRRYAGRTPYDAIFKPAYSEAYDRNMVLMIAWRKDVNGKVVAGAAASLAMEAIQKIAQQAIYGHNGYEMLLAADGTFIVHPRDEWVMRQNLGNVDDVNLEQLQKLIAEGRSGFLRYDENGAKKIAFYQPIPVAGWTLVSVVDEKELFMPADKLSLLVLTIAGMLILGAVMTAGMVFLTVNWRRSKREQEMLQMRNEELKQTQERLVSLDRMKDDFLAQVSHELKTPLHGMIGLAESTRNMAAKTPVLENLEIICRSGSRLANLVDEIVDFSVLRNHQVILHRKAVSLRDIVQMVLTLESFSAQEKGILLENHISAELPLVYGDEERLIQVFHNLVRNAIKFSYPASKVKVAARINEGDVIAEVRDAGIGIPQEQLELIFNPFEQGSGSGSGLGLGLYISQGLLELHQSTLKVFSKVEEGSCFSFTLPVWQETEHATARSEIVSEHKELPPLASPAVVALEQQVEKSGPWILIADDERVNLEVIRQYFRDTGYQTTCVRDGQAALHELEMRSYALVILDMMMPGLNGIEVCREIRKNHSERDVAVIMATVRNRPEDIAAAFAAGVNDYIAKPFHRQEFLARVEAQLHTQEAYDAERRIYEAEIVALQAQIQPHFLYNTLNTIIGFCRTQPEQAAELLEELSSYLQDKFRFNAMSMIPLQQELELIRSYVAIEKARFGSRLQVVFQVAEKVNPLIPPLILQPLVENAVKHGVCSKREGGTVRISVWEEEEVTMLRVEDDGPGMEEAALKRLLDGKNVSDVGIGLPNIHKRLQRHYGKGLQVTSKLQEGTVVTAFIPRNAKKGSGR
ncbi:ATP-binding protein [Anaeroarcus burkinensis]|uniref:ATP-binding protein n=1 Tax=Anaeroarcus burkinensis TaxID=82376 RepID=UPI00040022AD|nr:ATP-binding protein [Anaeroarcus burkinensis]